MLGQCFNIAQLHNCSCGIQELSNVFTYHKNKTLEVLLLEILIGGNSTNSDLSSPSPFVASRSLYRAQLASTRRGDEEELFFVIACLVREVLFCAISKGYDCAHPRCAFQPKIFGIFGSYSNCKETCY